jgi:8-oxo-dGTP pyrophosphatase MutT (NUDIX family)
MENSETTAEGAARETWEEAAAIATEPTLYRIFDVPHISQVYMFYRCGVEDGRYGVGPECLEKVLVLPEYFRCDELAFPVVRELLKEFIEDSHRGEFPVRHSVISLGRR